MEKPTITHQGALRVGAFFLPLVVTIGTLADTGLFLALKLVMEPGAVSAGRFAFVLLFAATLALLLVGVLRRQTHPPGFFLVSSSSLVILGFCGFLLKTRLDFLFDLGYEPLIAITALSRFAFIGAIPLSIYLYESSPWLREKNRRIRQYAPSRKSGRAVDAFFFQPDISRSLLTWLVALLPAVLFLFVVDMRNITALAEATAHMVRFDHEACVSVLFRWYVLVWLGTAWLMHLVAFALRHISRRLAFSPAWFWLAPLPVGGYMAHQLSSGSGILRLGLQWPVFAAFLLVFSLPLLLFALRGTAILNWAKKRPWVLVASALGSVAVAAVVAYLNATWYRGLYYHLRLFVLALTLLWPSAMVYLAVHPLLSKGLGFLHTVAAKRERSLYFHGAVVGLMLVTIATMSRMGDAVLEAEERHLSSVQKMVLVESSFSLRQVYVLEQAFAELGREDKIRRHTPGNMYRGRQHPEFQREIETHRLVMAQPKQRESLPARFIVIAIDALRFDFFQREAIEQTHLAAMHQIARDSLFFRRTYSPYPCTYQVLSAMFSLQHPYIQYHYTGHAKNMLGLMLDDAVPVFFKAPMVLLDSYYNDVWRDVEPFFSEGSVDDDVDSVKARIFLEQQNEQNPHGSFFLYLHLLTPHYPYDTWNNRRGCDLDERECYRRELRHVDSYLGGLYDYYLTSGMAENTHFIVISDHGEALGDFGQHGHCVTSREFLTHVPALWRLPDGMKRTGDIDHVVTLLDMTATVADIMGRVPDTATDGRSLVPLLLGHTLPPAKVVLMANEDFAVIDAAHSYVYSPKTGVEELYRRDYPADTHARLVDPGPEDRERLTRYREYLDAWFWVNREIVEGYINR